MVLRILLLLFLLSSILSYTGSFTTTKHLHPNSVFLKSNNFKKHDAGRFEVKCDASTNPIGIASIGALTKLLSSIGVGVYASKVGLLDTQALSVLSKLVFGLFQPCLLFVNVATTIAKSKSKMLLTIPMVAVFQVFLGFVVGKIMSFLFYGRKTSDDSKILQTCTTFGNSGPLPLVFTDALFRSNSNPILLTNSVGYISLYLLGWSPLFWIIAPGILETKDSSEKHDNKRLLKRIFSPPVIGSILGLLVGLVPSLKSLFIESSGLFNPLFESLRTIGQGYLPAVLLVLAGSLMPQKSSSEIKSTNASGGNLIKQVLGVMFARFLITPLVGLTVLRLGKKLFPSFGLFSDPLLMFVLLLETCMPSAQNSTVVLQLQGNHSLAIKMAQVLFCVYLAGVPFISYWISFMLSETAVF